MFRVELTEIGSGQRQSMIVQANSPADARHEAALANSLDGNWRVGDVRSVNEIDRCASAVIEIIRCFTLDCSLVEDAVDTVCSWRSAWSEQSADPHDVLKEVDTRLQLGLWDWESA